MLVNKLTVIPDLLAAIPQPPQVLYHSGTSFAKLLAEPRVAIVGSRKISAYGQSITAQLARDLAARGIVIVSGLAFGVDQAAHEAALAAGGTTLAVLPCPIGHIVPASNRKLAAKIIANGGALLSEYPPGSIVYKTNFVERNRLMSGVSDAVLITEAAKKSGSLHTAYFALDQGREVLAVPGNITSKTSEGTNLLIKMGASPVTDYKDVLQALGLSGQGISRRVPAAADPAQQALLDLVASGISDSAAMQSASGLQPAVFNQALTMLEVDGKLGRLGGDRWQTL